MPTSQATRDWVSSLCPNGKPIQTSEEKWLARFIARWDTSSTAGRVELLQEIVERVAEGPVAHHRISRETIMAAKHVAASNK